MLALLAMMTVLILSLIRRQFRADGDTGERPSAPAVAPAAPIGEAP